MLVIFRILCYNIKYYIKGVFPIFVYWVHGDYSVIKEFVPFILKYGLRQYCYTFINEKFITEDDIFLDKKWSAILLL